MSESSQSHYLPHHWQPKDPQLLNLRSEYWIFGILYKLPHASTGNVKAHDIAQLDMKIKEIGRPAVAATLLKRQQTRYQIIYRGNGVLYEALEAMEINIHAAFEAVSLDALEPSLPRLLSYLDVAAYDNEQQFNPDPYPPF